MWSYLQLAVSGAATAYVGSFSAYCVFRFLMGMTFSGIILNSLSLGESSPGGTQRGWGHATRELQHHRTALQILRYVILTQKPQFKTSYPGVWIWKTLVGRL